MAITNATIKALLKDIYPSGLPADLTYKDYPFLALIHKNEKFYGDFMKVPLKYANNSGRSASFSVAQANTNYSKNVAFFVERAPDYAVARLTNEELESAEHDQGAFVKTLQHEIDAATKAAVTSEAISLAEDGEGTLAQISTTTVLTTPTLILRDPELVVRFEVGQKIQFSSAKVGGTLRASGATLTINAINRNTGTLTMSANLSTITGITVNDWLVHEGDFQLKQKGFGAWVPENDPTSTPFFGVDRTADIARLSGVRDDFSSLPIEEAIIKAVKRVHREGSSADYAFINFEKFAEFENALGSKVQIVDVEAKAIGVGFRGIVIHSGKNPVKVIADATVPSNRLWIVQLNTWELASLKKSIRILDQDGNKMLRVSNADSAEIRIGGYKQFICNAPGFNGNFKI